MNYGAGTLHLASGTTQLVTVRSTREDVTASLDRVGTVASVTVSTSDRDAFPFDGRDRRWEVGLPADLPTSLTLNVGAGDFDVDVSGVQVKRATISAGASDLKLRMPKPAGEVAITVSAGASDITIEVPDGAAYRVTTTGALHSVSGTTESSGYAGASDRLTIALSVGASSVTIR